MEVVYFYGHTLITEVKYMRRVRDRDIFSMWDQHSVIFLSYFHWMMWLSSLFTQWHSAGFDWGLKFNSKKIPHLNKKPEVIHWFESDYWQAKEVGFCLLVFLLDWLICASLWCNSVFWLHPAFKYQWWKMTSWQITCAWKNSLLHCNPCFWCLDCDINNAVFLQVAIFVWSK